jgi:hypothetical protein
MNDRVDFFCARPEHQRSEPSDALTMHNDHWAYCPGSAAEDHEWHLMPTGGKSLVDVKRFVRRDPIRPIDRAAQRSD